VSKYIVLCDYCEGGEMIVAWIDDNRPSGGGVDIVAGYNGFKKFKPFVANRRGGQMDYRLRCSCNKEVPWSETTAGDVIDKIAPFRDQLETIAIPVFPQQPPGLSEDEQAEQRQKRLHYRLLALMDEHSLDAALFGTRYVIPFSLLCSINSKLDKRR
jgi:hypothetical protein